MAPLSCCPMPTYEYKCPAGHVFEKFYPTITDNRRLKCPTCGKMAERQISGGVGLVFKGSGFYATDYKRAADTRKEPEGDAKAAEPKPADAKPADGAKNKKKKDSGDKSRRTSRWSKRLPVRRGRSVRPR